MRKEMDNREMEVDSDKIEVSPGILLLEREDRREVLYLDSHGNYWDEVRGKLLSKELARRARLEELKELDKHNVLTEVPVKEC